VTFGPPFVQRFALCYRAVVCPVSVVTSVYCGQTAAWIKMPLVMEVGLSPGDNVLDGDPAPPHQKAHRSPPFSAHVYCSQTAGWIKMSLGTAVGLGPGDIVLDRNQLPPTDRGITAPTFRPMSIVAKRSPISATAELLLRSASEQTYRRRNTSQPYRRRSDNLYFTTIGNTSRMEEIPKCHHIACWGSSLARARTHAE